MNANVGKDYHSYAYFYTVNQVPKFHYFSILIKGKGEESHTSPPMTLNPPSKTLN